jgi:hypothetical protein
VARGVNILKHGTRDAKVLKNGLRALFLFNFWFVLKWGVVTDASYKSLTCQAEPGGSRDAEMSRTTANNLKRMFTGMKGINGINQKLNWTLINAEKNNFRQTL